MNWGVQPCWRRGSLHHGIHFLQRFPELRTLTLVIKNIREGHGKMGAERYIVSLLSAEFKLHPYWQCPQVRVVKGITDGKRPMDPEHVEYSLAY